MRHTPEKRRARIDLHGMTLTEAHAAVMDFMQHCYAKQIRHLEIITGKGNLSNESTIRREVPLWLDLPPWKQRISSLSHAPEKEGGIGALRVVFKKFK